MAQRTLACGVPVDVYDQFVAALPAEKSINSQLRDLIDWWLERHGEENVHLVGVGAGVTTIAPIESTSPHRFDTSASVTLAPTTVAVDREMYADTPVGASSFSAVPDPGCLHPKGVLYRSDRLVVCGACGRTIR